MIVDSHCHLDRLNLEQHNNDLGEALLAAKEAGVDYFLCVCINLENFPNIQAIAAEHDRISISVGVHPTDEVNDEPTAEQLVELAKNPKVVAIGETGLDYFRSEGDLTWQHERFRQHIRAAKSCDKPLIVHTRDARQDTLRILKEENADTVGGVLHCFTEDWAMAEEAIELGFYISISGIVTFKNAAQVQEVAQKVPLERLLIETDSPYLAPVPYRGKSNEPAYVKYVAEKIADLRGESFETIAKVTSNNFYKLFKDIDSP